MPKERDAEGALCLDTNTRRRVEHRLNRLAGQVEGIHRMIEEERGCEEILPQIASIRQAANGLAGELLQAHIGQCVRSSMEAGDEEQAVEQIQGVVKGVLKYT
jgi:DNA-binding FrmR family transcriptional regulator